MYKLEVGNLKLEKQSGAPVLDLAESITKICKFHIKKNKLLRFSEIKDLATWPKLPDGNNQLE